MGRVFSHERLSGRGSAEDDSVTSDREPPREGLLLAGPPAVSDQETVTVSALSSLFRGASNLTGPSATSSRFAPGSVVSNSWVPPCATARCRPFACQRVFRASEFVVDSSTSTSCASPPRRASSHPITD